MARVVGLTGGIGSGKSEALEAFRRHGAAVLSSDEIVRGLYARADVVDAVREHFGDGVIDGVGAVDRAAIAARVFADASERRWLEGLLLPLIQVEFERWRDERLAAGDPLLVHEAPTLFEAGIEAATTRSSWSPRPATCASSAGRGRPTGWRCSCRRRRRRGGVTWCTRTPGRWTTSTAGWPA